MRHMRNCFFHENKFKLDCMVIASNILTDVVMISLREIISHGMPAKKGSRQKWSCSDVLA